MKNKKGEYINEKYRNDNCLCICMDCNINSSNFSKILIHMKYMEEKNYTLMCRNMEILLGLIIIQVRLLHVEEV